jgi:UDP-N-acetylmuramoyl-tripeptide--D-alanyl-D-alanine ligase
MISIEGPGNQFFTITPEKFIQITKARVAKQGSITLFDGISINGYLTTPSNLYIALNSRKYNNKDGSLGFSGNEDSVFGLGGVFDGHESLAEAQNNGAIGFVLDQLTSFEAYPDAWVFLVDDSLTALAQLARYHVEETKVKVVGVTGSTGKTSTTYSVAQALRSRFQIRQFYRTRTSFLGLALDILTKLQPNDDFITIEMQMDGPGQISRLCRITPPNFSIITNVNNSHLERMGNMGSILAAKLEIYSDMHREGQLIINADNSVLSGWLASHSEEHVITYGLSPECTVRAANVQVAKGGLETTFNLVYRGESQLIRIKLPGTHSVYTALATSTICLLNGYDIAEVAEALEGLQTVPGRLQCFRGLNNCYVLDDAYNANLASMLAALDYLSSLPVQRRIAFIGSMLELADAAERDHRLLGQKVVGKVDTLIVVGEAAAYIADEARKYGLPRQSILYADSVEEAISLIPSIPIDEDTGILVKGSGAMRLDRITVHLVTSPIT